MSFNLHKFLSALYGRVLSPQAKDRLEAFILLLSAFGFLIHLAAIGAYHLGLLQASESSLLASPISAIYTPFSFILIYEVYLLVYHLPASFSESVARQYEIISLIIVRNLFKDISRLDNTENWLRSRYNMELGIDMLGFLLIFYLIYRFYRLMGRRPQMEENPDVGPFIRFKKGIALVSIPILVGLVVFSLGDWIFEVYQYQVGLLTELSDVNKIFYDEFFTYLILVDVVVLIFSFRYTRQYSLLIRNTGFIVSTILIRLSFTAEGLLDMVLVVAGVLFGTLILGIYNQVARLEGKTA